MKQLFVVSCLSIFALHAMQEIDFKKVFLSIHIQQEKSGLYSFEPIFTRNFRNSTYINECKYPSMLDNNKVKVRNSVFYMLYNLYAAYPLCNKSIKEMDDM
ncbi:MAG: hypothetical protein WA432_03845 [Candidatus Babeliaceae bacterium]